MDRKELPLFEFDGKEGKVRPDHYVSTPKNLPERCVIAFSKSSVAAIAEKHGAPVIAEMSSCTVNLPIYEVDTDGVKIAAYNGLSRLCGRSGANSRALLCRRKEDYSLRLSGHAHAQASRRARHPRLCGAGRGRKLPLRAPFLRNQSGRVGSGAYWQRFDKARFAARCGQDLDYGRLLPRNRRQNCSPPLAGLPHRRNGMRGYDCRIAVFKREIRADIILRRRFKRHGLRHPQLRPRRRRSP